MEFQKKHNGFKLLKYENLETLLSIEDIKNEIVSTKAEIPIFFHPKTETFCYFLSDNFVNVNKISISFFEHIKNIIKYSDDNNNYIGFMFNDMHELLNSFKNENSAYSQFKDIYEEHISDIKNGSHVIIITYDKNENSKYIVDAGSAEKFNGIIANHSNVNFLQAFKFGKKYYLLNKDGSMNEKNNFMLTGNENIIVIDYSVENWKLLEKIYSRLNVLNNNLEKLFNNPLLLENNNLTPKLLT